MFGQDENRKRKKKKKNKNRAKKRALRENKTRRQTENWALHSSGRSNSLSQRESQRKIMKVEERIRPWNYVKFQDEAKRLE